MADVSRAAHQALIIPETVEVWATETTVTEASPAAGLPVPSAATHLALTAGGAQSEDLTVRTITPGLPVSDAFLDGANLVHSGCRNIWRKTSETDTDWRGWDPPRSPSSWQEIIWNDSTVTSITHIDAATSLTDDTVVVVAEVVDTDASLGLDYRLEAIVRSTAGAWTRVLIEAGTAAFSPAVSPCIVALPSGRLQVYRIIADPSGSTYVLRLWYSDDSGTTWSFGGDGILDVALTATPSRLRVAYSGGQLALMVRTSAKVTLYASSDSGLSFQEVGDFSGNSGPTPANFDLVASPAGGFIAAIIGEDGATGIDVVLLSDAYELPSVASVSSLTSATTGIASVTVDEDVAVMVDATGLVTLIGRNADDLMSQLSYDGGVTWGDYAVGASTGDVAAYGGTGSSYLEDLKLVAQRGRGLLIHRWSASGTTTAGDGLACLYLGGWTSVTQPSGLLAKVDQASQGWTGVYYPTEVPAAGSGWTVTGTGSEALTAESLRITTDPTETRISSRTIGASTTGAAAVRVTLRTTFGTDGTDRCAVKVTMATGAVVGLRFTTTGFQVYDHQAAALVGSKVTVTMTVPVSIWLEVDGISDEIVVFYRSHSHDEDRVWIAGPTGTLTTSGTPTSALEWGHLAAPAGTGKTSDWLEVVWADNTARVGNLGPGFTNPTDLRGRMMTGDPYIGEGLRLKAKHGPSYRGEEWSIPSRPQYRIEHAIEEPSPRISWRSTSTATQTIALKWDDAETKGDTTVLAIVLRGSNIPEFTLSGYASGAWASLGTVDLTLGTMSHTREGSSVVPGASGAHPYLRHGDYQGATMALSASVARRIDRHTEGGWDSAKALTPVVRLLGVDDGADPASGSAATIIPSQVVVLLEISTTISAIRIVIPDVASTTAPAESYWEIGSLIVGRAYPIGYESAWGRVLVTEHPTESVVTRDRQNRVVKVAPPIREVTLNWTDGIDQTSVESDTADPDWVALDTDAGASDSGTAYAIDGLLRQIHGDLGTLVYLPRVPVLTGTDVLTRRRDAVHGRISGIYRRETVQGEEHVDEVVRISALTITEEV